MTAASQYGVLIGRNSDAVGSGDDDSPLAFYLTISHIGLWVLSAAVVALWIRFGDDGWYPVLLAITVATAIGTGRLRRRDAYGHAALNRRARQVTWAHWTACVAATLIEPWVAHLTLPLLLVPVVATMPVVDGRSFRFLAIAAIGLTTLIIGINRFYSGLSGIHGTSSKDVRDLVLIVGVSAAMAGIMRIAWLNHHQLRQLEQDLESSNSRLMGHRRAVEEQLVTSLADLRAQVLRSARRLERGDLPSVVEPEVRETASQLRAFSHGVYRSSAEQFGLEHAVRSLMASRASAGKISIVEEEAPSPLAASAALAVLAELLEADAISTDVEVSVVSDSNGLRVHLWTPRRAKLPQLSDLAIDRLAGAGGSAELELDGEGSRVDISIPHRLDDTDTTTAAEFRSATQAIRAALVFPVVAVAAPLTMYLTVLPYDDLLWATRLTIFGLLAPCLVAWGLSRRWPSAALILFAVSHWIVAVAFLQEFHIIKLFVPIALAIPVVLALPYVTSVPYALLTAGTIASAVGAISIARLSGQSSAASESPDFANDLMLMAVVPITALVLVRLARASHSALRRHVRAAQARRRDAVAAADDSRRHLERDLHDGPQQRLVAALLQLRLAQDAPDAATRQAHAHAAGEALTATAHLLEDARQWADPGDVGAVGLATAVRTLAATIGGSVQIAGSRDDLPLDVQRALFLVASEAVTNIIRHGDETSTAIQLDVGHDSSRLRVANRIPGAVDEHPPREQLGLRSLAARVAGLDGTFSAGPIDDQWIVEARIPVVPALTPTT